MTFAVEYVVFQHFVARHLVPESRFSMLVYDVPLQVPLGREHGGTAWNATGNKASCGAGGCHTGRREEVFVECNFIEMLDL